MVHSFPTRRSSDLLTDGRIVVAVSNSQLVRVYGSDGTLESEHDVAINQVTMSADDTLAAWMDENSRVVVLESGVAEPATFERSSRWRLKRKLIPPLSVWSPRTKVALSMNCSVRTPRAL